MERIRDVLLGLDWERMAPGPGSQGEPCCPDAPCDGVMHFRPDGWVERCPARLGRVERVRLAGALAKLGPEPLFASYDRQRVPAAERAHAAMLAFAGERRPKRGVLLSGETGLGKSHLIIAGHFARLDAGFPSRYVTSGELRPLFRDAVNFNEDVSSPARTRIESLRQAPVLLIDDLGDVLGSVAFHSDFAAGFKTLLDGSGAVLAVALNLGSAAAAAHPDIGERVLSRLRWNAEVVRIEGEDARVAKRGPR